MKKIVFILIFLSITYTCSSQTSFDRVIKEISLDLAGKLKLLERRKIVVLFVTDINKSVTTAGTYLADNISFNLVNDATFKVFERDNLSSIKEAKQLIDDGYINAEKTKELGKLLSVNAIIIGNYTILNNTIKLSLKALSTDNGVTIAASMINLPLNADICRILNISGCSTAEEDSKNPNCKENNTGDYCFKNTRSETLKVTYWGIKDQLYPRKLIISSNETQCLYDIPSGSIDYKIEEYFGENFIKTGVTTNEPPSYSKSGQLYVEQCKSKTFLIR